jgi:hypothetical protein
MTTGSVCVWLLTSTVASVKLPRCFLRSANRALASTTAQNYRTVDARARWLIFFSVQTPYAL